MTGTLLNVVTVLVGGLLGLALGSRLPERVRETVLHGLGLVTLAIGLQLTLQTKNILIVMGSILVGGILGEGWRIEDRLERLGAWLQAQVRAGAAGKAGTFVQGFVTASLVFCVGPMAVLGALQDGLSGDYRLLAIKSLLDGFAALAFASSMGVGVLFSALTVVAYQGTISLLAGQVQQALSPAMIAEMTATGGVLIMGIGLLLLEIKRIRVANFLPAILIAPIVVAVLERLGAYRVG